MRDLVMVPSLEILREHGEPMTLRELAAAFSERNDVRIAYDMLSDVLARHEKEGDVKCVAKHKKDWRDDKWQAVTADCSGHDDDEDCEDDPQDPCDNCRNY